MDHDLRALALMAGSHEFDLDRFVARANARFPQLGGVRATESSEVDWTETVEELAAGDARYRPLADRGPIAGPRYTLEVEGEPFACTAAPFPLPYDPTAETRAPLRRFEPGEALAEQGGHVTIAPMRRREGLDWARAQATVLQCLIAVAAETEQALAVHWSSSQGFQSPEDAAEAAETAIRGQSPIYDWVQFYPVPPAEAELANRPDLVAVLTLGLRPFLGRELEFATAPLGIADALGWCYAAIWLLVDRATQVGDRHILSNGSGGDHLVIRETEGWLRRAEGIPAYVLVSQSSVIDPDSLTARVPAPRRRSLLGRVTGRTGRARG